jgi:nucleotide-binding universal stress UspA family protein
MFNKVLFPTDFSKASQKALKYVKKLREAGAEEVVLLHVLDESEMYSLTQYGGFRSDIYDKVFESNRQRAMELLSGIADELTQTGLTVRKIVTLGVPFQEILRVEEEEDVSMIIIGSHGKSAMEGVMLGSVSTKIVRRSSRPVLVIRWKED